MNSESTESAPVRSPKLPVFLRVFFALFFFTVAVSVLVSYAIPPTYEATASIHAAPPSRAEDFARFHSSLLKAIEFANSDAVWEEAAANAKPSRKWKPEDVRKHCKIWLGRGSSRFDISAKARRPSEATAWAKSTAEAVIRLTAEQPEFSQLGLRLEGAREAKLITPAKPKAVGWGALIGVVLGALGGGAIVYLRLRIEARTVGKTSN